MKRVTPGIGMEFQVVEDEMRYTFLTELFQGDISQIPGRAITGLPVKQAGIDLPKPTRTAGENWTLSCIITGHLVAELQGTAEFRSGDHALLMGEGREEIRQRHAEAEDTALVKARAAASKLDDRRMGRIHRTWL